MKKLDNYLKIAFASLTFAALMVACNDEPAKPNPPLAFFTFEADASNSQLIVFTNETENGDSYVWDFGDASATSTDVNPTHEYADGGTYTVTLTATNAGGDNVYTEDVTVLSNVAVNLVTNGELNDSIGWTVIQLNANDNGSVTFTNGTVVFNEIVDIAEGGWGDAWAHAGMYQPIVLEVGTYYFDMDVITEGINETWCEVWIGTVEPVVGDDYNGDDGAFRIGMVNAWDCPSTITYTGALSGADCNLANQTFDITEANTYYLMVRSGGFNFGPNGITVDNISLTKQ